MRFFRKFKHRTRSGGKQEEGKELGMFSSKPATDDQVKAVKKLNGCIDSNSTINASCSDMSASSCDVSVSPEKAATSCIATDPADTAACGNDTDITGACSLSDSNTDTSTPKLCNTRQDITDGKSEIRHPPRRFTFDEERLPKRIRSSHHAPIAPLIAPTPDTNTVCGDRCMLVRARGAPCSNVTRTAAAKEKRLTINTSAAQQKRHHRCTSSEDSLSKMYLHLSLSKLTPLPEEAQHTEMHDSGNEADGEEDDGSCSETSKLKNRWELALLMMAKMGTSAGCGPSALASEFYTSPTLKLDEVDEFAEI